MSIRIEEHAYAHMYQCAACSYGRSINGAHTARYEVAQVRSFVNAVAFDNSIPMAGAQVEERAGLSFSVCATCLSGWIAKGIVELMSDQIAKKRALILFGGE